MVNLFPVILSGGSGSRLWPVSRENYPKQFCQFYDESFLHNSILRLKYFGTPLIVTLESMKGLTQRALQDCGIDPQNTLFEPYAKNTAPAIALVCHWLNQQGRAGEVVGIFPADHLITDDQEFRACLNLAAQCASEGEIVTVGLNPRYPATGYGYIEVHPDIHKSGAEHQAHHVVAFHEKPDLKTATQYVDSKRHYWNSGMFVFKAEVMIAHFQSLLPEMWEHIAKIDFSSGNARYQYANIDAISIDHGIMEKLKRLICIPAELGWSDVGSWDEIARLSEEYPKLKTEQRARVFGENANKNYVFSLRDKVVGMVGVSNIIVVETPDGLLIAKRGESQNVKQVVDQIRQAGLPEASDHVFEKRPWGKFEVLSDAKKFKVKTLTVEPGQQLSYQSHEGRDEHWVVVEGRATVVLDDIEKTYLQGDYVRIPRRSKHRLANREQSQLTIVEVQTGEYFGEDDIRRYQDDYNRI